MLGFQNWLPRRQPNCNLLAQLLGLDGVLLGDDKGTAHPHHPPFQTCQHKTKRLKIMKSIPWLQLPSRSVQNRRDKQRDKSGSFQHSGQTLPLPSLRVGQHFVLGIPWQWRSNRPTTCHSHPGSPLSPQELAQQLEVCRCALVARPAHEGSSCGHLQPGGENDRKQRLEAHQGV